MSTTELKVPDIGDVTDVEVIEILVAVGDTIEAEQSLVTVESDKASMEIPAQQGGVVKALLVKLGDRVSEGSPLLTLETAGGGESTPAKEKSEAKPAAAPAAKEPAPAPVAKP